MGRVHPALSLSRSVGVVTDSHGWFITKNDLYKTPQKVSLGVPKMVGLLLYRWLAAVTAATLGWVNRTQATQPTKNTKQPTPKRYSKARLVLALGLGTGRLTAGGVNQPTCNLTGGQTRGWEVCKSRGWDRKCSQSPLLFTGSCDWNRFLPHRKSPVVSLGQWLACYPPHLENQSNPVRKN